MKIYTELYGWGNNSFGQLGLGERTKEPYKLPRIYSFQIVIQSVSCGEYHSLCLSSSGFVYTMGSNSDGRLGIDDLSVSFSYSPCLIKSLSKVSKIACGSNHSLAITENGEVYA